MRGIYKYIDKDTDEIVYIGKSNDSITARINAHKAEEKFKEYIDSCDIYYIELPNAVEIDLLERALINKYKPILNDTDNLEGFSSLIQINEPDWVKYEKGTNKKKDKDTKIYSFHLSVQAINYVRDYAYTNRLTIRKAMEQIIFEFKENHSDCRLLQNGKRR